MKKLFTVIRQGKLDEVARILDKNPSRISCLAVAPPKKQQILYLIPYGMEKYYIRYGWLYYRDEWEGEAFSVKDLKIRR